MSCALPTSRAGGVIDELTVLEAAGDARRLEGVRQLIMRGMKLTGFGPACVSRLQGLTVRLAGYTPHYYFRDTKIRCSDCGSLAWRAKRLRFGDNGIELYRDQLARHSNSSLNLPRPRATVYTTKMRV